MNNSCKGIDWTQAAMDSGVIDPNGLIISAYEDWSAISDLPAAPRTWADQLTACRAWADAKEWGTALCCQLGGVQDSAEWAGEDPYVVNSAETVAAEVVSAYGMNLVPHAEVFNTEDFAMKLGVTFIMSTLAIMMQ